MPAKLTPKNNSEHFIELANKRVPKALKALDDGADREIRIFAGVE